MEKLNFSSDNFLTDFYIPDYILVPGSQGEVLPDVLGCPILVFINSRSGGQLGGDLLVTYCSLLNKNQVVDLTEEAPDKVLRRLYITLESRKANRDMLAPKIQEKLRIIRIKENLPVDNLSMWLVTHSMDGVYDSIDGAADREAAIKRKLGQLSEDDQENPTERETIFKVIIGEDGHAYVLLGGNGDDENFSSC